MKNIVAKREPTADNLTARCPSPLKSILCAGKTLKEVESSGTPMYVDGIKSKNVWVIRQAKMYTAAYMGGIPNDTVKPTTIIAMLFACSPGSRPVKTPLANPSRMYATMSSTGGKWILR